MGDDSVRVHPTAEVSKEAVIGKGTRIWNQAQVRERATIGEECIIGKGSYVDADVRLGDRVKVQNNVSIFHGVTIESGVFVGPHVCFTNDRYPRAVSPDGCLKSGADWTVTPSLVQAGASIGANSTIVCGVTIGRWAMVGAGSTVTRDVPRHGLVYGHPAKLHGIVCSCGAPLEVPRAEEGPWPAQAVALRCKDCGTVNEIDSATLDELTKEERSA